MTGASDGIGKEFGKPLLDDRMIQEQAKKLTRYSAKHLANRRFNIILVSRTASKLEALAAELANNKYKIETKTLAMDFTRNDDADYARLADLTRDLDVSILINNVGQSHSIPVPFLKTSLTEMQDIVTVNCLGTLRVTQTIAPGMVERKRGLVLTMASFGGILPTPLLATYSGSKAFLQQWSTALGAELEPQGVTVQLVQSYLVTSAMSKIRKASMFVPDPKSFVEKTMDKIGRSGGAQGIAYTCTPYWAHAFMHWGIATFVGTTNKFVLKRNYDMHKQIRTRALKKADRDSKKGL